MTVILNDPVAVPHQYRNRFLRDNASKINGGSSSSGGDSLVDLSGYLRKSEASALYVLKSVFEDLFEKVTLSDGTSYIRAKYTLASDGGLLSYGYGKDNTSGVSWSQITTEGTCIAQISIDGVVTNVYAPNGGGGSGSVNSWTDIPDRPSWLDSYLGTNKPPLTAFAKAGTCITIGSDSSINVDVLDLAENELGEYFSSITHGHVTNDITGLGSMATKNSLSFAELSSHPTTLSGYGITDALPLIGGTMSGEIDMNGKGLICVSSINGYDNDYAGASGAIDSVKILSAIDAQMGFYDSANNIEGDETGYSYIVFGSGRMKLASNVSVGTSANCTGNSATATKLQTSRLLWGRSFDGSGNVQGNLENVGSISFNSGLHEYIDNNGNMHLGTNSGAWNVFTGANVSALHILNNNGYVGVLKTDPIYPLDVTGDARVNGSLRIGNAKLSYNSTTHVLKLEDITSGQEANFVATGGLTAYGIISDNSSINNFNVNGTLTLGDEDNDTSGILKIYSASKGDHTTINDIDVVNGQLYLSIDNIRYKINLSTVNG